MKPTTFNKVFLGLIFFLVLFYSFWLGIDVQRGDTKEIIADAVLLCLWLFALVFFIAMDKRTEKLDRELDKSKEELDKAMNNLLGEILGGDHSGHDHHVHTAGIENETHQRLSNIFDKVLEEVVGDEIPTTKDLSAIRNKFVKATGHDVKLEVTPFGLSVKIAKEPIAKKKPATKKAPVKKSVAKAPTKKTVTKKGNK